MPSLQASDKFQSYIQNQAIEIGKLDLSQDVNQNRIVEIFNLIQSTKDEGQVQNIKGFGPVLANENELIFLKNIYGQLN